ncbi:uncharacterized protein LOC143034353 [Oratosquilla oratoria]|uniref:uncharacterized protein LOC143034353 n=1 Tax=Oratosquilla oratoria TaxID=337810 RepID=UPI003F770C29
MTYKSTTQEGFIQLHLQFMRSQMNSSIVVLILGAVAFASAEPHADLHLCRCGLFTTGNSGEYLKLELPGIDVASCNHERTCEGRCIDEFDILVVGGNLYAPSGNSTVGQKICDANAGSHWHIHREMIYLYSEICSGPWRYSGKHSMQLLCCDENDKQQVCA